MSILLSLAIIGLLTVLAVMAFCDRWVSNQAEDLHSSRIQDLPPRKVAVVLGCSEKLANGRTNLYFKYRIEAAAALFRAGKCESIIVSGDNSTNDYDEPSQMKNALIGLGVPPNRVESDYAGFRTLDSVVRAKAIFDQSEFIVVSQKFHNERAIYIAKAHGLDAVGFDARDVSKAGGIKTRLRESLARVKTILDVHVLSTEPKFLGPKVAINQER